MFFHCVVLGPVFLHFGLFVRCRACYGRCLYGAGTALEGVYSNLRILFSFSFNSGPVCNSILVFLLSWLFVRCRDITMDIFWFPFHSIKGLFVKLRACFSM
jgi:hypothetical protein